MGVASTAADLVRVLSLLPIVELRRRRDPLHSAVAQARRSGALRDRRSAEGRSRLRRVISAIDTRIPGGGNCVRRALLEMSLDGGAADECLLVGFKTGGGPKSGHAWLESEGGNGVCYDAVMPI